MMITGRVVTTYVLLTLTGCVFANNAGNWAPQTPTVNATYYACLQQAQQGYSQAVGSVASAGQATNIELLKSCMQAAGYQKRASDVLGPEAASRGLDADEPPNAYGVELGELFDALVL